MDTQETERRQEMDRQETEKEAGNGQARDREEAGKWTGKRQRGGRRQARDRQKTCVRQTKDIKHSEDRNSGSQQLRRYKLAIIYKGSSITSQARINTVLQIRHSI